MSEPGLRFPNVLLLLLLLFPSHEQTAGSGVLFPNGRPAVSPIPILIHLHNHPPPKS